MLWKSFSLIKVWPRRESWFIKSVDIMENCHCHQGGEGETRGILRTKWSRRWDLHFSWLQLAEKPQPHSLANASEKRHFSSYFDYFKTVLLSTCCMTTDNKSRSNFCRVILILWQLMRAGSVGWEEMGDQYSFAGWPMVLLWAQYNPESLELASS